MVGKQVLPDKTSPSLTLEGLVPKDNFYRRLKPLLDLTFLYPAVEPVTANAVSSPLTQ